MSTRPGLYVTEDTAGAGVRATMGFRGLGAAASVVWATTTTGFFVAAGVGTNFRVLGDKGSVTSLSSLFRKYITFHYFLATFRILTGLGYAGN